MIGIMHEIEMASRKKIANGERIPIDEAHLFDLRGQDYFKTPVT